MEEVKEEAPKRKEWWIRKEKDYSIFYDSYQDALSYSSSTTHTKINRTVEIKDDEIVISKEDITRAMKVLIPIGRGSFEWASNYENYIAERVKIITDELGFKCDSKEQSE